MTEANPEFKVDFLLNNITLIKEKGVASHLVPCIFQLKV